MNKKKLFNLFSDIRFWLIFFFLIRLFGITNPPLEAGHNWRQSLTNMIARNFLEVKNNIFYPMIDMGGEKTGIIGSEFPLYNYIIYLVSEIFGYDHWYGRLINLIVCSIAIFFFYKLIRGLFSKTIAFNSSMVLILSIWFSFSRKIMPDTFSIALMIIGLFYAYYYLKEGSAKSLILFFIFSTLGILCKIPALTLFSGLAVILFINTIPKERKVKVIISGVISFAIACTWYFYWVPYLLETYGYQLYYPRSLSEGLLELKNYIPDLLEKFYFNAFRSFIAAACFFAGIYFLIISKNKNLKIGICIISVVFVVFIIKTGYVFAVHSYYVIPFTPVMVLLAGIAISKLKPTFQTIILIAIAVESIANNQHDFFTPQNQVYKLELEAITEKYIPKDELSVINGGLSPQDMYFTHCKGWTIYNNNVTNQRFMDSLQGLGAKYLIIDEHKLNVDFNQYQSLYRDSNYSVYALKPHN